MQGSREILSDQAHVDSDMVDADQSDEGDEGVNDEYMIADIDSNYNDEDTDSSHEDSIGYEEDEGEGNSEDESLQRLSMNSRRRQERRSGLAFDDSDEISPEDFLRRLINARTRRVDDDEEEEQREDLNDDNEDDDEFEDGDPRSDFLRAMGSITYGGSRSEDNRGTGFAEVVQRLMGGGIILGGRDHSDMENLIQNLNQREDSYIILETLNELSERLLMMNGITAERVIPANSLAQSIIHIMEDKSLSEELELQLVACRCLYNFLEVNQDFVHDALNNNAVEVLCEKLMEISYIDLTEQALQTLEMISRDSISHNPIVAHNGLKACLNYLDFLTIHAQRRCLTIVANSCSNIKITNFDMVKDVFDIISNVVVNHNDSTVIENGWLAISRIITSFRQYPKLLETLFLSRSTLLQELCHIIVISCNKSSNSDETRVPVKYGTCLNLTKSLITLVSVSVPISNVLIEKCKIGKTITRSLNKFTKSKGEASMSQTSELSKNNEEVSMEALMSVPKELLNQFLILIGYFLPITYDFTQSAFLSDDHKESSERSEINEARIRLFTKEIPQVYKVFADDVWTLLINTFQATMDYQIRKRAIICLYRISCFGTKDNIMSIQDVESISGLLASIVGQSKTYFTQIDSESKDIKDEHDNDAEVNSNDNKRDVDDLHKTNSLKLLLGSFFIAEELLNLHDKFVEFFTREGIVDDILLIADNSKQYSTQDSPPNPPHPFFSSNTYIDAEIIKDLDLKSSKKKLDKNLPVMSRKLAEVFTKSSDKQQIPKHMQILSHIKDKLNNTEIIKGYNYENWKKIWTDLKSAILGTDGSNGILSFELISSGIIETLSRLFTTEGEDFGFEFSDCYRAFVSEFFIEGAAHQAISFLVAKLQDSLNRLESFEVVSSGGPLVQPSIYQPVNDQTTLMARQVKLRLVSVDNELNGSIKHLQNLILSVHAIATFRSVDTFLKQRLQILDDFQGATRDEGDLEPDKLDDVSISSKNEGGEELGSFEFLMDGEIIPVETTIFGAVYRALQIRDKKVDSSQIWTKVHDISFRKIERVEESEYKFTNSALSLNDSEQEIDNRSVLDILKLLKVLFEMNTFVKKTLVTDTSLESDKFMNWKLTVKLNRQLDEPLVVASGILPGWSVFITRNYPFIFPLETRIFFLQSTSFGYSRLIQQWQIRTNQESENESNRLGNQKPILGRPTRIKVKLSRKSIFQSAMKVLNLYGHTPGILEIEYFDEVGSGLGPTLEFYSTVSKEFSKRKLRLWRDNSDEGDDESYVNNISGLFPAPLDKNQIASENGKKVLYFCSALGKFIARALIDSRIIDFNFNVMFLKLVQLMNTNHIQKSTSKCSKKIANISCLRLIDPALATSMEHLLKYVKQFPKYEEDHRDEITVDGATLKDLTITLTLPGYPDYELIPNGDDIIVNSKNVESYINKVLEATLYSGVIHQIRAFMEGFSKVFPIESLIVFSADELANLYGNAEEDWSFETLFSSINANHGYSKDSVAIKWLIEILVDLNNTEKRAFLQFLTGAPKLPVGGFRSLHPELTVVKKVPEDGLSDDDFLPSVMTCANYLKLPNYSSKTVMKSRILQAINEGAGAFLLS